MNLRRAFLGFWAGGLAIFALAIALGMPLVMSEVPGGILDHQAAGSAAEIDRIHATWRSAGLFDQALAAMAVDLVFIGIYGIGCILGGLYFRQVGGRWFTRLGTIAAMAGGIFLLTDYAETIAQIMQLMLDEGDDRLAGLAAAVRPWKIASWVAATLAIIAALLGEWRASRSA